MAYKIIVQESSKEDLIKVPGQGSLCPWKEIYSQTVETLDLPTIILAVNKGGVTETLKDWFKKLTEIPKK